MYWCYSLSKLTFSERVTSGRNLAFCAAAWITQFCWGVCRDPKKFSLFFPPHMLNMSTYNII